MSGFSLCKAARLSFFYFAVFSVLLTASSFIPQKATKYIEPSSRKTTAFHSRTMAPGKPFLGDKLFVLYLKNTGDSPQLYQLLKEKQHKRIVLQFYLDVPSGSFGLYAYPAKRIKGFIRTNRSEFDTNAVQKLTISKMVGKPLNGEELLMGGLQLSEEGVKKLRKHVVQPGGTNKTGFEYIWFIPVPQRNASTGTYVLTYRVEPFADEPKADTVLESKDTDAFALANPSPPRRVY